MKITALTNAVVRSLLRTADSMAWSFAARKVANRYITKLSKMLGRKVKPAEARQIMTAQGVAIPNPNDWREARAFAVAVRKASLPADPADSDQLQFEWAA